MPITRAFPARLARAAATACALWALGACHRGASDKPKEQPPTTLAPSEVVTVGLGTVATGPLVAGTLEAARGATLNAEAAGTVREIGPEIGEKVTTGTVLVKIDPSAKGSAVASAGAAVQAQQIALSTARRHLEQTRKLVADGAVTRTELDNEENQVAALQAQLAGAQAQSASASEQLGNTVTKSPLDGVVARRNVKVGDVVSIGQPLYQVIDPTSLRLEASVPAEGLSALRVGAPVQFQIRGYGDRTFAGAVARVSPAADPQTRQIPVLVDLPNPGGELIAGVFAQGRLATQSATGLTVPIAAVDDMQGTPSVLKIVGDTVERTQVTLGLRDPMTDRVVVTKGLVAGDRIVARAVAAPTPGTKVATSAAQKPNS